MGRGVIAPHEKPPTVNSTRRRRGRTGTSIRILQVVEQTIVNIKS